MLAIFTFSFLTQAFVIINHDYRLSNPTETKVNISRGSCDANGLSVDELKQAIEDALSRYWNTIGESELSLSYGGVTDVSMNEVAPSGTILVGCGPLSGASGVAQPNIANGSAVVTLDSNAFVPGGYVYEGLVFVVAHELGHAIGLAHSDDSASVMTYNNHGWGPSPTYLSQDDKDGVVYLYPYDPQLGGLLGSCSAVASPGGKVPGSGWDFFLLFLLSVVGLRLLLRRVLLKS